VPDFRRLGSLPPPDAVERDGRAEALLVDGLNQYFEGHYEEAINLWTRVLFLDRAHARARAYIDRARTALAEHQRRADEILHATDASLARGDAAGARELLNQAEAARADDTHAAELRRRLERLETAGLDVDERRRPVASAHDAVAPVPVSTGARWAILPVALVLGAGLALLLSQRTREWLGISGPPLDVRSTTTAATVPGLTTDEVAMTRARTLMDRGRLAEALRALDRVSMDGEHAVAADTLRVRIQQLLLADTGMSQGASRPEKTETP
jgi:hypothetical protein